jgi:ATP-dependent DNA ligase
MLLLRTESLASGQQWLYELKLDGYRAMRSSEMVPSICGRGTTTISTAGYPAVVEALARLPDNTVIDGEVVAFDQEGRPSFNALQNYGSAPGAVVYYVFDVMVLAGQNVMREPLEKRRELLEKRGASEVAGADSVLGTARRRPAGVNSIGKGPWLRGARCQASQ